MGKPTGFWSENLGESGKLEVSLNNVFFWSENLEILDLREMVGRGGRKPSITAAPLAGSEEAGRKEVSVTSPLKKCILDTTSFECLTKISYCFLYISMFFVVYAIFLRSVLVLGHTHFSCPGMQII